MTRREALLLLPMLPISQQVTIGRVFQLPKPGRWHWHLDDVESITVTYRGQCVTIDPPEIFAALQSAKDVCR